MLYILFPFATFLQNTIWHQVRIHAVMVIGLYKLLGNPTTKLIEPLSPREEEDPVDSDENKLLDV